jgi:hypothetical protein
LAEATLSINQLSAISRQLSAAAFLIPRAKARILFLRFDAALEALPFTGCAGG